MCEGVIVYIFGYGSLIWRPGFPYLRKFDGYIKGWKRYFWQGSTDHRGTPEEPGRVVTLVKDPDASVKSETWGTVYCVPNEEAEVILKNLDYREKGGYTREDVDVYIRGQDEPVVKRAILYIATEKNSCYTGATPVEQIAHKIYKCIGPSGPNVDYLLNLAHSMRRMNVVDDHIVELERLVRDLIMMTPLPHHTHPLLFQSSPMGSPDASVQRRIQGASSDSNASDEAEDAPTNNITLTVTTSTVSVGSSVKEQVTLQRRYFMSPNALIKGVICIDDGAVMAVSQRGRSLLAAGIVHVEGEFKPQDLVSVISNNGIEISRGISIYSSSEIVQIKGKHSSVIDKTLGFTRGEAVVHHDNMILV